MYIVNSKPDIFHAVIKELIWNVENPSNIFNGNFFSKNLETDRKAIDFKSMSTSKTMQNVVGARTFDQLYILCYRMHLYKLMCHKLFFMWSV